MQKYFYQGKVKTKHFKLSSSRKYNEKLLLIHVKINDQGKNTTKTAFSVKPAAECDPASKTGPPPVSG